MALGSSVPGSQGSPRFQESAAEKDGTRRKERERKRERERERERGEVGGGCNDGERANCRARGRVLAFLVEVDMHAVQIESL